MSKVQLLQIDPAFLSLAEQTGDLSLQLSEKDQQKIFE
jgi:hypothetical protein